MFLVHLVDPKNPDDITELEELTPKLKKPDEVTEKAEIESPEKESGKYTNASFVSESSQIMQPDFFFTYLCCVLSKHYQNKLLVNN